MFDISKITEKNKKYVPIVKAEGDYAAFESNGLACRILRMPSGHLNGYVAVSKDSPLYGKKYYDYFGDDEEKAKYKDDYVKAMELINGVEVHGGLTYAYGQLRDQPEKDVWWFGFDTAHGGDIRLSYDSDFSRDEGATYKDMAYVKNECESLAKQLSEIEQKLSLP